MTSFKSRREDKSLKGKYFVQLEAGVVEINKICQEFLQRKEKYKPKKRSKQNLMPNEKLKTSIEEESFRNDGKMIKTPNFYKESQQFSPEKQSHYRQITDLDELENKQMLMTNGSI